MKITESTEISLESLDKLNQTDLLIFDDFGLPQLEQQQYDLLRSDGGPACKKGYHHISSIAGGQLVSYSLR